MFFDSHSCICRNKPCSTVGSGCHRSEEHCNSSRLRGTNKTHETGNCSPYFSWYQFIKYDQMGSDSVSYDHGFSWINHQGFLTKYLLCHTTTDEDTFKWQKQFSHSYVCCFCLQKSASDCFSSLTLQFSLYSDTILCQLFTSILLCQLRRGGHTSQPSFTYFKQNTLLPVEGKGFSQRALPNTHQVFSVAKCESFHELIRGWMTVVKNKSEIGIRKTYFCLLCGIHM